MSRFLSSEFDHLVPYTPGEQPQGGSFIKLNTNESPFPPAPGVFAALNDSETAKLRLYSDPEAKELVRAIAESFGVSERQVFAGNGSDEILAFSFLAWGGERPFRFPSLSYGFYPVFANLFGVRYEQVPLRDDFTIDTAPYEACGANVVIANPNAPTGLALTRAQIERIVRSNPDNAVVIDEAYVDFGAESSTPLLEKYDNLLIVQTFSKSRCLAGARIGFALGSEEMIRDLNTMKFSFNPYNLDRAAILAGAAAVRDKAYTEKCTSAIMKTRGRSIAALRDLGLEVLDSSANFFFARPKTMGGAAFAAALRRKGILVRRWDDPRILDWMRISVGSDGEMDALIRASGEILREAEA